MLGRKPSMYMYCSQRIIAFNTHRFVCALWRESECIACGIEIMVCRGHGGCDGRNGSCWL